MDKGGRCILMDSEGSVGPARIVAMWTQDFASATLTRRKRCGGLIFRATASDILTEPSIATAQAQADLTATEAKLHNLSICPVTSTSDGAMGLNPCKSRALSHWHSVVETLRPSLSVALHRILDSTPR